MVNHHRDREALARDAANIRGDWQRAIGRLTEHDTPTPPRITVDGADVTPWLTINPTQGIPTPEHADPRRHERLAGYADFNITLRGTFQPADEASSYWPTAAGTATITQNFPANRRQALLARLARIPGLRWIKPRTIPVKIVIEDLDWTKTDRERGQTP